MDAQTTQKTTKREDLIQLAERSAAQYRKMVLESCRQAVAIMEEVAAKARREFERAAQLEPWELACLPSELTSQSAWGSANAASELSTATRLATQYMNALGEIDALKGGAR